LGLTPERFALVTAVLLLAIAALYVALSAWLKPSHFATLQSWVESFVSLEWLLAVLTLLGGILLIVGAQVYQYAAASTDLVHQAYFTRLQPLVLWLAVLIPQTILSLLLLRYGKKVFRKEILRVVIIFGVFLLIWGWITRSGYGFTEETPETGLFHNPNAPIMGVQVFLAWGIAMLFGVLWYGLGRLRQRWCWLRFLHNDLIVGIAIWLVTYIVWMGVPLEPSWFANPPLPPTYSFSPNSDAFRYDSVAHSLLVGQGFRVGKWSEMVERPMLSFYLAVFHAIAGLGYEQIIGLQVAFLAFIPVLAYRLTKSLHNHVSGVLVALMLMLRERNAILLGDTITVSHAKLLLSELPAMLGVLLFLWLFVEWSKEPKKRGIYALIAGGVIGFFMLIRQEIGMIVFWVGLGALFVMFRRPGVWLRGMALLFVGLFLMVGPWIWRDYSTAPNNREAWLLRNDPGRMFEKFKRLILPSGQTKLWDDDTPMSGWQGTVVKVDLKPGPRYLENSLNFDAFLNHIVDSSVQSVLYLPVNNRALLSVEYFFEHHPPMPYEKLCCELERFVRNTPYWWPDWSGELPSTSYIPFGLTLLLIVIGLGTVWKRQQWIGLFPLLALFAHIIVFALMKRSGGRFLVVTDWASAMYYGIGLVELSVGFLAWLNVDELTSFDQRKHRDSKYRGHNKWIYGFSILVILSIGAAPPAVEKLIPERYTSEQKQARLNALLEDKSDFLSHEEREMWETTLSSGGSVMFGRALYPNFYQSGTAKEDANELARQQGSRIEFYLVGTERHYLEVPTNDWLVDFPHGSDVVVLGCETDIVSVAIYSSNRDSLKDVLWREPILEYPITCPLPGE
jgi:uncharacterized membrane-anchored protein YitT (DUF2179 family)